MRVILIGVGAQAKYALENLRYDKNCRVAGLLDTMDNPDYWGKKLGNAEVLGDISLLKNLVEYKEIDAALVCVSQIKQKEKIWHYVQQFGLEIISAIHPRAVIAETAKIGQGVIINACAVVQPFAQIGNGVMIHAGVIIEHNNIIEDFVNLAPGVTLAGWVHVETRSTVFTGAKVVPKVRIGSDSVVGAGSVVLENVSSHTTVVGIPARVIKSKQR